jgi:hypothetical protein
LLGPPVEFQVTVSRTDSGSVSSHAAIQPEVSLTPTCLRQNANLSPLNDKMESKSNRGKVSDRPFWIRTGSVFIRAVHLLAASAVSGAYLLTVENTGAHTWWLVAGISGVLLLVAEFIRHVELYRELGGWSTILKLVLIGCIPAAPATAPWLMSAAFVIAVLGAHFPRRWRHRKLF